VEDLFSEKVIPPMVPRMPAKGGPIFVMANHFPKGPGEGIAFVTSRSGWLISTFNGMILILSGVMAQPDMQIVTIITKQSAVALWNAVNIVLSFQVSPWAQDSS